MKKRQLSGETKKGIPFNNQGRNVPFSPPDPPFAREGSVLRVRQFLRSLSFFVLRDYPNPGRHSGGEEPIAIPGRLAWAGSIQ